MRTDREGPLARVPDRAEIRPSERSRPVHRRSRRSSRPRRTERPACTGAPTQSCSPSMPASSSSGQTPDSSRRTRDGHLPGHTLARRPLTWMISATVARVRSSLPIARWSAARVLPGWCWRQVEEAQGATRSSHHPRRCSRSGTKANHLQLRLPVFDDGPRSLRSRSAAEIPRRAPRTTDTVRRRPANRCRKDLLDPSPDPPRSRDPSAPPHRRRSIHPHRPGGPPPGTTPGRRATTLLPNLP
jgi:hypothetical protein